MGGMAEMGGVWEAMSERLARRSFSGVEMSMKSGVSATRLPVRLAPLWKVRAVMP